MSALVPCPGCGGQLHPTAAACHHCGYRPRLARVEDILGSLVTISSILAGFGLSAVVQLASVDKDSRTDWLVQGPMACWIVAALLLLGVIVMAEFLRRREVSSRIAPASEEEEDLWARSRKLLNAFVLALFFAALGVVLLGFWFSLLLGLIVLAAVVAVALLCFRP